METTPSTTTVKEYTKLFEVHAQAKTRDMGLLLLASTILFAGIVLAWLHYSHNDYDALRELFANIITGEIGLISGLNARHRD